MKRVEETESRAGSIKSVPVSACYHDRGKKAGPGLGVGVTVFTSFFTSEGSLPRISSTSSYQMSSNYRKNVCRIFNHHFKTKHNCFTDDIQSMAFYYEDKNLQYAMTIRTSAKILCVVKKFQKEILLRSIHDGIGNHFENILIRFPSLLQQSFVFMGFEGL